MLRATGRTMNQVAGVPRLLLQSLCRALGTPVRDIATLRSIYARPATLSAHLDWIRQHTGFRDVDAEVHRWRDRQRARREARQRDQQAPPPRRSSPAPRAARRRVFGWRRD